MVNLSRRSFLIGTSAAVAAIALPVAINEIVPLVTDREFVWRRYNEIMISPSFNKTHGFRTISVFRKNGELPILRFAIHNNDSLRWNAGDDMHEIVIPYNDALRIDVEGGGIQRIDFIYVEKKLDGTIKMYSELHSFPSKGPPEICALEA